MRGHKVAFMTEWVFGFWLEVKGQSSKRAEVRTGDDAKLAATVRNQKYSLKGQTI